MTKAVFKRKHVALLIKKISTLNMQLNGIGKKKKKKNPARNKAIGSQKRNCREKKLELINFRNLNNKIYMTSKIKVDSSKRQIKFTNPQQA